MKRVLTERARESYVEAPPAVRKAFDKQAKLLEQKLRHPSLRAKKYDESKDRRQARINRHGVSIYRAGHLPYPRHHASSQIARASWWAL